MDEDIFNNLEQESLDTTVRAHYCIYCKNHCYVGIDGDALKSIDCNGECGEDSVLEEDGERKVLKF